MQPTYTPLPTNTPFPVAPPPCRRLRPRRELRQRTRSSWVSNPYQYEGDRFIADLTARRAISVAASGGDAILDDRRITTRRRRTLPQRARWSRSWGDWINNEVNPKGYDAYGTDPGVTDMSPLRLLVVRMIQGRQGALVDSQQHALHNFFTRKEDSNVWVDNVNGVIAAVNRESFQWQ